MARSVTAAPAIAARNGRGSPASEQVRLALAHQQGSDAR